MTSVRNFLLLFLLAWASCKSSAGETDSPGTIQVGGINLVLGMKQEDVLSKLSAVYDVRYAESGGTLWVVSRRGAPPYELVGAVSFEAEKLDYASTEWGPPINEQSARALSNALYKAVQSVTSKGNSHCTLSVSDTSKDVNFVVFECGTRRIMVTVPTGDKFAPGVDESVRGMEFRK